MPDRGDERGRGGTRTLVTGILAGTEWHPAGDPQEATRTAREARDLAVRLRPVLSKLAQTPRGGRRRDLDWLPAVEQLAVDAQYFASWWLPRLEGKSAQSWPSWSADGYADWVKRLDAQRVRTLEMVRGTAPVARVASVTQLRRGKGAGEAGDAETAAGEAEAVGEAGEGAVGGGAVAEAGEAAVAGYVGGEAAAGAAGEAEAGGYAGGEAATGAAREAEVAGYLGGEAAAAGEVGLRTGEGVGEAGTAPAGEAGSLAVAGEASGRAGAASAQGGEDRAAGEQIAAAAEERTARITPLRGPGAAHISGAGVADAVPDKGDAVPVVPRTPPNQGPGAGDAGGARVAGAEAPRVPRTPPNQGPGDEGGAAILRIPRTPPNSGPVDAERGPRGPIGDGPAEAASSRGARPADGDRGRGARAEVVSLVGEGDGGVPRVPRTPPNSGPGADRDADSTHVSLTPVGPVGSGAGAEETTRPLFRSTPPAPAPSAAASGALAGAGAAAGVVAGAAAGAVGGAAVAGGGIGAGKAGGFGSAGDAGRDEFEHFQPGSDLPPPVFPMMEPTEPVDRGRIVRYAAAAVVLAAAGVLVFVAATQKSSGNKTAATSPATSSSSSSDSASPSSASSGAVTAPTATAPPSSSKPSKPAPSHTKPSTPPASTPHTSAPRTTAAPHTSAAPPPVVRTTSHQPPPATGVSSLRITSLAPDATGGFTYIATVHVTTKGTGRVTVTVTFAGTSSSSSPGSYGAQSQSFTLSGKTSYDLSPEVDVHGMCPASPYIDAVASASGAASSAAYASSPC